MVKPRLRVGGVLMVLAVLGATAACTKTEEPQQQSSGTSSTVAATSSTAEDQTDPEAEAFCAEVEAQRDVLGADVDPEDDESLDAWLEGIFDVAQFVPDAIADEYDQLVEIFTELQGVPADERLGELLDMDQDELDELTDAVDEYTLENCGFEFAGTGGGSSTETTSRGSRTTEEEVDLSTDAMDAFLEENYGDETWYAKINSWTIIGGGSGSTVAVGTNSSFTEDEALAACEALSEWLYDLVGDGEVEVQEGETAVASRASIGDECTYEG